MTRCVKKKLPSHKMTESNKIEMTLQFLELLKKKQLGTLVKN